MTVKNDYFARAVRLRKFELFLAFKTEAEALFLFTATQIVVYPVRNKLYPGYVGSYSPKICATSV